MALSWEQSRAVSMTLLFLLFLLWGKCWFLCRQFQCRQCQDLLENNLALKRPIKSAFFLFPFCSRNGTDYFVLSSAHWEEESGSLTNCCEQGQSHAHSLFKEGSLMNTLWEHRKRSSSRLCTRIWMQSLYSVPGMTRLVGPLFRSFP